MEIIVALEVDQYMNNVMDVDAFVGIVQKALYEMLCWKVRSSRIAYEFSAGDPIEIDGRERWPAGLQYASHELSTYEVISA